MVRFSVLGVRAQPAAVTAAKYLRQEVEAVPDVPREMDAMIPERNRASDSVVATPEEERGGNADLIV